MSIRSFHREPRADPEMWTPSYSATRGTFENPGETRRENKPQHNGFGHTCLIKDSLLVILITARCRAHVCASYRYTVSILTDPRTCMLSCQALSCGRRRMPWTCRCTASPEDGDKTSSKLDTGAAFFPLATSAFPCLVLRVPRVQSDRPYDVTGNRPNIEGRSRETTPETSNSETRECHRSIFPPASAPPIETFSRLRRQEAALARARLSLPERAHRVRGTPATGGSRSSVAAAGDTIARRTWMGRAGASPRPDRVSLLGNRTSTLIQARYRMPALVPVRRRDTAQRRWQCMERRRVAVAESLIASKGGGDRLSILSTAPRSTMADARAMRCAMR